jgi:hypothetical protein
MYRVFLGGAQSQSRQCSHHPLRTHPVRLPLSCLSVEPSWRTARDMVIVVPPPPPCAPCAASGGQRPAGPGSSREARMGRTHTTPNPSREARTTQSPPNAGRRRQQGTVCGRVTKKLAEQSRFDLAVTSSWSPTEIRAAPTVAAGKKLQHHPFTPGLPRYY